MGNKSGRVQKNQPSIASFSNRIARFETAPTNVDEGEPVAVKKGDTRIDYDHFTPDPSMIEIDAELAMVSAKINIEDFKILKVLGRGTYGKVMLVQHNDEGTLYALKTLRKKKIIKTDHIEHTKAERR